MRLPNWIYNLPCTLKLNQVRTQQDPDRYKSCESCGAWNHDHSPECALFTPEQAKAVFYWKQQEENMRRQAANYLEQLQKLHGKIAILRHENNKLRKANQKLRRVERQ